MKQLFENWRNLISEVEEEKPQVTCRCLCLDCVFNKDKFCYAKEIQLDYAKTKEGRTICECKTYEVDNNRDET